jgi:hypothetical protein
MYPLNSFQQNASRRTFLTTTAGGLGATALQSMLPKCALGEVASVTGRTSATLPHFTPRA